MMIVPLARSRKVHQEIVKAKPWKGKKKVKGRSRQGQGNVKPR